MIAMIARKILPHMRAHRCPSFRYRLVSISVPMELIVARLSKNAPKTSRGFGHSVGRCPRTRTSLGDLLRIRRATQQAKGSLEMKVQLWFRVTSLLVFLQIALGGLLTFSFITALPHIITGFAVLAFAIATLVMAQRLKPPFRPLQGLSIGLVSLIVVQIILGFTTLNTGNQVIAWIHLLVAMAIYGMAIAGTFMSMRLDYRSREQSVQSAAPRTQPIIYPIPTVSSIFLSEPRP